MSLCFSCNLVLYFFQAVTAQAKFTTLASWVLVAGRTADSTAVPQAQQFSRAREVKSMDLHNLKSVKLGPKLPVKSLKSSWIHCWWVCSCSKSKISKHLHIYIYTVHLHTFTIIYIDTDRCPTCSYSTGWEFIFGIPWYAIFWCNNSRWGAGKDEWVPWSLLSSRRGIPQNAHLKAMYKNML